jgi:Fe-S-cluster-containing hydrogenase component 2
VVRIEREKCVGCGGCVDLCPTTAISLVEDLAWIDANICLECTTCVKVCPVRAPQEM